MDLVQTQALSPLLGIGCRSGDTVIGLSSVRRAGKLAFVFASGDLAVRTLRELAELAARGVRVYLVEDFSALTKSFGRADAQVVENQAVCMDESFDFYKRLVDSTHSYVVEAIETARHY